MPNTSLEGKRATQARWRERNRQKILAYKEANRDKINEYGRNRHSAIMRDPELAEKQKARRRKYYEANRDKCIALEKAWRHANPDRVKFNDRNKHYKRNYGITEHDYLVMHSKQGGVCAICGNTERAKNRRLAVDHCHSTGAIRALLCGRCNGALGWFEKHKDLIVQYLGGS